MSLEIREALRDELDSLLELYIHLHTEEPPERERSALAWESMLTDPNHHVLLGLENGRVVSSCILALIPNLTRNARPYGLIENVVTHPDFRGGGRATALLKQAVKIAAEADCYKVMLLTGRKDAETLSFYRGAGFNSKDKTAFICWL